jgi:SAM-dependent methyltransferase
VNEWDGRARYYRASRTHAEDLPFEDASYDVCACRVAAHHFDDPAAAMGEMARVSRRLVVVEGTLFVDERVQAAERLRDSTHVRHYSREEWLRLFAEAGLDVVAEATFQKHHDMADWLSATGCTSAAAVRARELLSHVSDAEGAGWTDVKIVLKGAKRA